MTTANLFSTYLHDAMAARRMTFDELIYELGDPYETSARAWCDGLSVPIVADLPKLAAALRVNLLMLATGWMIDQLPELEIAFHAAILEPLGSTFPLSTDLTLRAPAAIKVTASRHMSVADPHDAERCAEPAHPATVYLKAIRKRPLRRTSLASTLEALS